MNRKLLIETLSGRDMLTSLSFVERTLPVPATEEETGLRPVLSSVGDIDGDGDLDIVGQTSDQTDGTWFLLENSGGEGERFVRHDLQIPGVRLGRLQLVDIDGDGDQELVSTTDARIVVLDTNAGLGDFQVVAEMVNEVSSEPDIIPHQSPVFADLDDDGDLDAVVIGFPKSQTVFSRNIYVGENLGGEFVLAKMAPIGLSTAYDIEVVDVDGNGTLDIVAANMGAPLDLDFGGVAWYSSVSIFGTFEDVVDVFRDDESTFPPFSPIDIAVRDLDGDADVDLLVGGTRGFRVYENQGRGDFSLRIEQEEEGGVGSYELYDLDLDDDLDIVSPLTNRLNPRSRSPVWFENTDGLFDPGTRHELVDGLTALSELNSRVFADFDGDGDIDIAAASGHWYESNATAVRADVDGDGAVGFKDFLVLANNFGREDDEVAKADGDVNGDGAVNFLDFLMFAANFGEDV